MKFVALPVTSVVLFPPGVASCEGAAAEARAAAAAPSCGMVRWSDCPSGRCLGVCPWLQCCSCRQVCLVPCLYQQLCTFLDQTEPESKTKSSTGISTEVKSSGCGAIWTIFPAVPAAVPLVNVRLRPYRFTLGAQLAQGLGVFAWFCAMVCVCLIPAQVKCQLTRAAARQESEATPAVKLHPMPYISLRASVLFEDRCKLRLLMVWCDSILGVSHQPSCNIHAHFDTYTIAQPLCLHTKQINGSLARFCLGPLNNC